MRVPSSLSSLSSSLSGISLLRNLGAQALERPREPRLDGSSRATQDRGRLLFTSLSTSIYNAGCEKVPGVMANDDVSGESLRTPRDVRSSRGLRAGKPPFPCV